MSATHVRVATLALAAACGLLPALPAHADQPDIFDRQFDRAGVFTTCDTFEVNFVSTITAHYIVTLDSKAQPVREIRHVSFTGTLTGPAADLPYSGDFTRTADFVTQTARFTGVHLRVTLQHQPPLLAAGTDSFSLDPSIDDSHATGRIPEAFFSAVCAALTP
jgi:hypothetical protein